MMLFTSFDWKIVATNEYVTFVKSFSIRLRNYYKFYNKLVPKYSNWNLATVTFLFFSFQNTNWDVLVLAKKNSNHCLKLIPQNIRVLTIGCTLVVSTLMRVLDQEGYILRNRLRNIKTQENVAFLTVTGFSFSLFFRHQQKKNTKIKLLHKTKEYDIGTIATY